MFAVKIYKFRHICSRRICATFFLICLTFCTARPVYSLQEAELYEKLSSLYGQVDENSCSIKQKKNRQRKVFVSGSFIGKGGKKIAYTKFSLHRYNTRSVSKKGVLVISPGCGEPSLKYMEVAFDFMTKGYEPVYVIDQRGQGASDSCLGSPYNYLCHLDSWEFAVEDLEKFIIIVQQQQPEAELFLLAHSMGALYASLLKKEVSSLFTRIDMACPFFGFNRSIRILSLPKILHCVSILYKVVERVYSLIFDPTTFHPLMLQHKCKYTPGIFSTNNSYTSSILRFNAPHKFIYSSQSDFARGCGTACMALQMKKAIESLQKSVSSKSCFVDGVPRLILLSDDELVVNSSETQEVIKLLPIQRRPQIHVCSGKHELLQEADEKRDHVLERIFKFYKLNSQKNIP